MLFCSSFFVGRNSRKHVGFWNLVNLFILICNIACKFESLLWFSFVLFVPVLVARRGRCLSLIIFQILYNLGSYFFLSFVWNLECVLSIAPITSFNFRPIVSFYLNRMRTRWPICFSLNVAMKGILSIWLRWLLDI